MKNARWLLAIGLVFAFLLVGCSEEKNTRAEEKPAAEKEAAEPNEEKDTELDIPEAAIHNVEKIVKEKGKYNTQELTEENQQEILQELEMLPDNLTGEEA